ncbi:MAG TPA: DsbA family protein [Polyangia bacterium]|nr:DsbA family protein [Polyangia bacterium]
MTALNRSVDQRDWVRGPADAPVTLLEYGDFECPFCGQAFWELKQLEQEVGERVRFVFRHFPLAQAHPHAGLAAEAAEAAGAQGKFWEMHDTLFTNQSALELSDLLGYADDLRLDKVRFTRDLEGHRFLPKVRRDFREGVRSGVNGTPTIFIDGQRWDGPYTAAALLAAISGNRSADVDPMTGLPWGFGTTDV